MVLKITRISVVPHLEEKTHLSPATLYAYTTEFEKFLTWLIDNSLAVDIGKVVTKICDVLITILETLPLNDVKPFQRYLQGEGIETKAINRTFSA